MLPFFLRFLLGGARECHSHATVHHDMAGTASTLRFSASHRRGPTGHRNAVLRTIAIGGPVTTSVSTAIAVPASCSPGETRMSNDVAVHITGTCSAEYADERRCSVVAVGARPRWLLVTLLFHGAGCNNRERQYLAVFDTGAAPDPTTRAPRVALMGGSGWRLVELQDARVEGNGERGASILILRTLEADAPHVFTRPGTARVVIERRGRREVTSR